MRPASVKAVIPRRTEPRLDQVKRLKELETENSRLLRAVSGLTLDKTVLVEAVRETSKPRASPLATVSDW